MPRSLPGLCTGCSLTSTSPLSARSKSAISRNNVDLPHPDGPSRTRNSPMSRPADENASSISKLMFSSALTRSPFAAGKDRFTLRTVILDFLCSMFGRVQVRRRAGHRSTAAGEGRGRLTPREKMFFQNGQQEAEQESRDADRDNAGIDALEVQHFARSLDHVSHSLASVDHLREDHISPANVVENTERSKNRGKGSSKYEPKRLPLFRTQRVSRFQKRVIHAVRFFDDHG